MPSSEELLSQLLTEFKAYAKAEENRQPDVNPFGRFTVNELYTMSKRKEAADKFQSFYSSEYAKMTVKELTTGTSNVALPTMVQAKALLELKNWADLREVSMTAPISRGVRLPNSTHQTRIPLSHYTLTAVYSISRAICLGLG